MKAAHRFDNAKRRRGEDHDRQRMLTPEYVLEPIRELLGGIDLDPCTEPNNPTQARLFYSPPSDGCKLPWDARNVFCNPPYGEARNKWVERCINSGEARPTILLIPSHTETQTVQRALRTCSSVCFVQARLRFGAVRQNGRQEAASHGSVLFGFGIDLEPLSHLGVVFGRPVAMPLILGKVRVSRREAS
jgi:hypothetical protein